MAELGRGECLRLSVGRAGHSENASRSRRQSGCHSGDEEGVHLVPGDSLGATLEARRSCP